MKKYVCDILSLVALLIAVLALIGWARNIPPLYQIKHGWINMNPLSSIGVIAASFHCISRAFVRRETRRRRMLTYLGISYACAFLLFIWQLSFLIVEISDCVSKKTLTPVVAQPHENLPSMVTTFSLFAYSITGFCTRQSWTVASWLIGVGGVCLLLGYAPGYHPLQIISANTATCFLLLGMAIYVARRTGPTHWFINECKQII